MKPLPDAFDRGDMVRFRHPHGGAWLFGMVECDTGGEQVSIVYLALNKCEPCRHFVLVPREWVRGTYPDPAWWSDDRPDENTIDPPDTPHVVPAD